MTGKDDWSNQTALIRCAVFSIDTLLRGKWQVHILFALRQGPVRIGQLGRLIPGASKKVLAESLRKLEARGIVVRRDLSDLILHVEYELHPDVRVSLGSLLDQLSAWGASFLEREANVAAKERRSSSQKQ
ncbi:winged helix-turn-helix transcriptional regulator [Edaphobacter flagellatus]|uniref:winged helix-turn-helix transcriptional regulator n=1 Tax=Edaphobacter flagellatus TaxID=1933044 RepID=UPI0036F1D411